MTDPTPALCSANVVPLVPAETRGSETGATGQVCGLGGGWDFPRMSLLVTDFTPEESNCMESIVGSVLLSKSESPGHTWAVGRLQQAHSVPSASH